MDKNLKKIIPFALHYKRNVALNIVFNVFYAFFSTMLMVTLMPTLNVIFEKNTRVAVKPVYTGISNIKDFGENWFNYNLTQISDNYGAENALLLVIGIVILTALLKNLFNYLASRHVTALRNGVLRDVRQKLYKKIIHLPVSYYSDRRKGDVMARMLGDVGEVQNSFFQILELIVREPLTILFSIIAMFVISAKLTMFVFIFIPISGFIISRIGKNLKSKSERAQIESGVFISTLDETLTGLKVVKGFNAENIFIKKFNESIVILRTKNNEERYKISKEINL